MTTDIPPQPTLSASERRDLRARAHPLHPLVMISSNGASPAVLAEVERTLARHELIKIRVMDTDRDERESLLEQICRATGAQPVQHIGKILIVYRQNPTLGALHADATHRSVRSAPRRTLSTARSAATGRSSTERSKQPTDRKVAGQPVAPTPRRFVSAARRQLQQRRKPAR